MTKLAAHGLSVGLPTGWEGRIQRRAPTVAIEQTFSVVHLANFALPEERDDFGGGVTPLMRSPDVFVVLFEYGPDSLGRPLFAAHGVPRVTADMFGSKRLQRPLPVSSVVRGSSPPTAGRSASTWSPEAACTCRASSPR